MAEINKQYQNLILQIKQDADNFADQQMQTVYKNQKDHLTELHKYLGLLFVTYAVDGLLKVTPYQKNNILSGLNSKLTAMAKDMGNIEVNQVSDILKKNYQDTYYKNAYVMDSGINVNLKFDLLKQEYIDAAVNSPLDGQIFSKRIWANKAAVADKVKQGIIDAMNGDTTIDKLGKSIQEAFNIGAYESQRLVNTENARVQSQAIDDIGESAGVEKQMYCATLEANTCSECAEYDGQYYDLGDDSKPDIPLHPNCRCCYINVTPVGWESTVRKNNESKDIIDYEDYNKWAEEKGINNNDKILNQQNEDAKIEEIRNSIKSGGRPLTIEEGKQGKHILGNNNYIEGRSYLTISQEEAQDLVNKYAGTGTFEIDRNGNVKKKELIESDKIIGVNINNSTGEKSYTNRFYIHYSKKGTHIVPTLKGSDKS